MTDRPSDEASARPDERTATVETSHIEDLYRLLVDTVQDYAIFLLSPEGRILSWNRGAERIKGYTAEEILGKHFSVFYPAEQVARRLPYELLATAAHAGQVENEGWRVRKDGKRFWADVVITALRNEHGELVGFAKVTRDLTERHAAEADARELAASKAASQARSEFLESMSHELRTPLNAIINYVALILDGVFGPVPEPQRGSLQRIKDRGQYLLTLVSDLLDYSKLARGELTYDIKPVPIQAVVGTVAEQIAPLAQRKQQTLDYVGCPPHLLAHVDRERTAQILFNLLSNAVKFTPAGGRIEVSCEAMGRRVALRVQDTGPGVPADKVEAIFEPFVQLGRRLSSPVEGTGLGLAISRELARAMGGDVTVSHAGGPGATFTLQLPV